jgi:CubicO group peptidase (beta-lactamase class C family)
VPLRPRESRFVADYDWKLLGSWSRLALANARSDRILANPATQKRGFDRQIAFRIRHRYRFPWNWLPMHRRTILQTGLGLAIGAPLLAAMKPNDFDAAADVLTRVTDAGQVEAAAMYVRHGESVLSRSFGAAPREDAIFLLASISKPMSVAAVMTLYEQKRFQLDDPVHRFLPEFSGDARDRVTMRHLLTHVSGLPDQLPENTALRSRHAELDEFVERAMKTPLRFVPGSQYSYSSMGILLASEVARRISGKSIATLVDEAVYRPLEMKHSAMGIGRLDRASLIRCQVESAAAESGSGDRATRDWDWNSDYWRQLGAPWGGAHGSAADVARFLDAFLHPQGRWLQPDTARLMTTNHNPPGIRPRGLGFDLGSQLGGGRSSAMTFGHGGSTGTLCWADPASDAICVILTTLPSQAANPHPREVTSKRVAEAIG